MSWYDDRRTARDDRRTARDDRRAARTAVAALMTLAVVDVVHTVLSIGYYEDRITVVTHGRPDLSAPAFAYALLDYVVEPMLGRVTNEVIELSWMLAVVVAAVAVSLWWLRDGRRWDRVALGWIAAAVALRVTSVGYDAVTAPGYQLVDGALSTRPVAYSLWLASTVALVMAVRVMVRRIR